MKTFQAFLALFLFSCKKEVTELPPASQTGANTFGCRIDGTIWTPQKNAVFSGAAILETRQQPDKDLFINARNFASSPNETEFEILIKNVNATGTYTFNTAMAVPGATDNYIYYVKRNVNPINEWLTSATYSGTVTIITYDTVQRFVSGTFQLQAINLYNTPQPITVTERRFDVRIQ